MERTQKGIRKRMIYNVIPTPQFENDMKYYKKNRKFRHVDEDVDAVVEQIENGNLLGNEIDGIKLPYGEEAYKVRVANTDTRAGTSNGYRLIYYVVKNDKEVYLLALYYKKDKNNILTKKEISSLIKKYCT